MFDNGSLLRRRKRFKTSSAAKRKSPDDSSSQPSNELNTQNNDLYYDDDDDDLDSENFDNETNFNDDNEENEQPPPPKRFMSLNPNEAAGNKQNIDAFLKIQQEQQFLQYINLLNQHQLQQHQQQHNVQSTNGNDTSLSSASSLAVSINSNKTVNNISPLSSSSSSSILSTPESSKSLRISSSPNDDDFDTKAKKTKQASSSFSIDSIIGSNDKSKEKSFLNKLNSQSVTIKHRPSKIKSAAKTVLYQELFKQESNENSNSNRKSIYDQQLLNLAQTCKKQSTSQSNSLVNSSNNNNSCGTSVSSTNSRIESRSSNSSGSRCVSPANNHNLSVDVELNNSNNDQKNLLSQTNLLNSFLNTTYKMPARNALPTFLQAGLPNNMLLPDALTSNLVNDLFPQAQQAQQKMNPLQSFYNNIFRAAQFNYLLYNQNPNSVNSQSQGHHQVLTPSTSASSNGSAQSDPSLVPLFLPMRS